MSIRGKFSPVTPISLASVKTTTTTTTAAMTKPTLAIKKTSRKMAYDAILLRRKKKDKDEIKVVDRTKLLEALIKASGSKEPSETLHAYDNTICDGETRFEENGKPKYKGGNGGREVGFDLNHQFEIGSFAARNWNDEKHLYPGSFKTYATHDGKGEEKNPDKEEEEKYSLLPASSNRGESFQIAGDDGNGVKETASQIIIDLRGNKGESGEKKRGGDEVLTVQPVSQVITPPSALSSSAPKKQPKGRQIRLDSFLESKKGQPLSVLCSGAVSMAELQFMRRIYEYKVSLSEVAATFPNPWRAQFIKKPLPAQFSAFILSRPVAKDVEQAARRNIDASEATILVGNPGDDILEKCARYCYNRKWKAGSIRGKNAENYQNKPSLWYLFGSQNYNVRKLLEFLKQFEIRSLNVVISSIPAAQSLEILDSMSAALSHFSLQCIGGSSSISNKDNQK